MAWKEIIVHQGSDKRAAVRLDVALRLAKPEAARVTGVWPLSYPVVADDTQIAIGAEVAAMRKALRREAEASAAVFQARLAAAGIEGELRLVDGAAAAAMRDAVRHADLAVVGQADPDDPAVPHDLPQALVLAAGRPVLVVPYAGKFAAVGKRVLVAWHGTREAARAVGDAMPLLIGAEQVVVYEVDPVNVNGAAQLASHLADHGVKVEARHIVRSAETGAADAVITASASSDVALGRNGIAGSGRHSALHRPDVGDALLAAVSDTGADLLVMGAYGHSRLREFMLGGATRQILRQMTVPVLMSH